MSRDTLPQIGGSYLRTSREDESTIQRQYLFELQEKLKAFSDEVKKKDDLIRQLMAVDVRPGTSRVTIDPRFEPPPSIANTGLGGGGVGVTGKIDLTLNPSQISQFSQPALGIGTSRSAEHTSLQLELREKNDLVILLQRENQYLKEENAKLQDALRIMKKQLEELEKKLSGFDLLKGRSDVAVTELQKQLRISQERVLELEGRLRSHLDEKERADQQRTGAEKRLIEVTTQLVRVLGLEGTISLDPEKIVVKVAEIVQENAILKGKAVSMQAQVGDLEKEHKAHRETVQQLMRQVQATPDFTSEKMKLKEEIEKSKFEKKQLEKEVDLLKSRLESIEKQHGHLQKQLDEKDAKLSKVDVEKRETAYQARNAETQMAAMRSSIASMLSDAYFTVPPTEEAIKQRIQDLLSSSREKHSSQGELEEKLKAVSKQFQAQYEAHHEAEKRVRLAEQQTGSAVDRVRSLEQELAASDVIRDGLRADKEKCMRLLERLIMALKLDQNVLDLGMDMIIDAILGRIEQVTKTEAGVVAEKSTLVYQQQRKLQRLKEQLESKELHIDLLRKKLAQLEERLHGKVEMASGEAEEAASEYVKKAEHRVLKLQKQLEEARAENNALKAELLECSNLRIQAIEQDKEVQALERTLDKLEHVRQKQAKKIAELKGSIEDREREHSGHRNISEGTVQALSTELRQLKLALEDTRRREDKLVQLRAVIARMLGLEVSALPIPDVEILNRLERLVHAHQDNTFAAFTAQSDLDHMAHEFKQGYEDAHRLLGRPPAEGGLGSAARRGSFGSREGSAKHKHKHRSRSPSPGAHARHSSSPKPGEVDPRAY